MQQFKIRWLNVNNLAPEFEAATIPLLRVAKYLAQRARARAMRGVSAKGSKLPPLRKQDRKNAKTGKEEYSYLAPPHMPQPAADKLFTMKGKKKGWAAYKDYKTYHKAVTKHDHRDVQLTGDAWRNLTARRANVLKVLVSFRKSGRTTSGGKRGKKKMLNADKVALAVHKLSADQKKLLMPSRADLKVVERIVQHYGGQACLKRSLRHHTAMHRAKRLEQMSPAGQARRAANLAARRAAALKRFATGLEDKSLIGKTLKVRFD